MFFSNLPYEEPLVCVQFCGWLEESHHVDDFCESIAAPRSLVDSFELQRA